MTIKVVTKKKIIYNESVKMAQLPGVDGKFGLLENHAPMIYVLKKGTIKVKKMDDKDHFIEINGGLVEVFNNEITVLTD
jgi:F-type H+-transporting ATPase subunit epsilon